MPSSFPSCPLTTDPLPLVCRKRSYEFSEDTEANALKVDADVVGLFNYCVRPWICEQLLALERSQCGYTSFT